MLLVVKGELYEVLMNLLLNLASFWDSSSRSELKE
jgi:hypothetical protein